MAGSIRVAGHTIAEHDIVNDKVDVKNATLDSSVNFTDEYYVQGAVNSTYTMSSPVNINFDGSTAPYWSLTGDTTNFIQGTSASDLKFLKKGIYLINASLTCYLSATERQITLRLRGKTSGSSTVLARADDALTYSESNSNFGSASLSYVGLFETDDEINIYVGSFSGGNANLSDSTHFNICLIRPL